MKPVNKNRKIREIDFFEKQIKPKNGFSIRDFPLFDEMVKLFFKMTFLEKRGYRNTIDLKLKEYSSFFNNLPESFEGFKIVFISDLHLDGLLPLSSKIIDELEKIHYDLAILGGDYRYLHKGSSSGSESAMEKIVSYLKKRSEIIGILGNHDLFSNGVSLEKSGVKMLINDSMEYKLGNDSIYFAGVDDSALFLADDIDEAIKLIPGNVFKILLSHSPQMFEKAAEKGFDLMISGHTHGGQVCLPGGFALMKGAPVPRKFIKGLWKYKNLTGLTSTGVGVSVFPARFNCLPEISLLELKREASL